ncbi:MAG: cobyrinate a,c-diamide synthase [Peptoniphilus sp.]|nr:cobyrinate a,c-diamide synthase [Peptoniphilus sp.]MDD7363114.1 cobyrinate a,c-diamide synthase [Bacillota bacterium]MDY6044364.1 cobyrinate a,c-diamide synthase [Peptoniphilus sp.]
MTKRIILSAGQSSAGKTTLTMGLIRALSRRGLRVASAKIGPDYIDPMYHRMLGTRGYNLDHFLMEDDYIHRLLHEMEREDIVVMEGAMGYYDGIGATSESSCAEMSVFTDTPSILIFSGKGRGLSLAAEIQGFLNFKENRIAGIILNETKPSMYAYYKKIVEEETDLALLGCVPKIDVALPSRYLGLYLPSEIDAFMDYAEQMADAVDRYVDVDNLLEIAEVDATPSRETAPRTIAKTRVAIAMDDAFQFYYRDVLEDFERAGVVWVPFSPLSESLPRGISGIYLGGGYPERYGEPLSNNKALRADLTDFTEKGGVLIAEGGGWLSLLESIDGTSGWGLFPGRAEMTDRLVHFGYHEMTAKEDGLLLKKGESVPVHEFHYAKASEEGDGFRLIKPHGARERVSGYHTPSIYAGFQHIHLSGNEKMRTRVLCALEEAEVWRG